MFLTNNLTKTVLSSPAIEGCDHLYIVSGFASATMASKHLEMLNKLNKHVKIELLIGMCPTNGILRKDHISFCKLTDEQFPENFDCRYLVKSPSVHSKVYSWFKSDTPFCSFSGSANYTQKAFSSSQREQMLKFSGKDALDYFQALLPDTLDCRDSGVEEIIQFYDSNEAVKQNKEGTLDEASKEKISEKFESVKISFLADDGSLPERSGLNWGQRPELNRNPNQAYIRLVSKIYSSNFFPPKGEHFTVLTDDGLQLLCVRAQENGKAIQTPLNNSTLGEYFRRRLGLSSGSFVTKEDLLNYGRTDLEFYKIDEETFFTDFKV